MTGGGERNLTAGAVPSTQRRGIGWGLTVVSAIVIAVATLTPSSQPAHHTSCVICGPLGGVDAALNVLLFLPLGLGLAIAGVRFRSAMLVLTAATILIEGL